MLEYPEIGGVSLIQRSPVLHFKQRTLELLAILSANFRCTAFLFAPHVVRYTLLLMNFYVRTLACLELQDFLLLSQSARCLGLFRIERYLA